MHKALTVAGRVEAVRHGPGPPAQARPPRAIQAWHEEVGRAASVPVPFSTETFPVGGGPISPPWIVTAVPLPSGVVVAGIWISPDRSDRARPR
jgi:hypothetical protein